MCVCVCVCVYVYILQNTPSALLCGWLGSKHQLTKLTISLKERDEAEERASTARSECSRLQDELGCKLEHIEQLQKELEAAKTAADSVSFGFLLLFFPVSRGADKSLWALLPQFTHCKNENRWRHCSFKNAVPPVSASCLVKSASLQILGILC